MSLSSSGHYSTVPPSRATAPLSLRKEALAVRRLDSRDAMDPPWSRRRPLPAWRLNSPPTEADHIGEPMPRIHSTQRARSPFVTTDAMPERRDLTQQRLTAPMSGYLPAISMSEPAYRLPGVTSTGVWIDARHQPQTQYAPSIPAQPTSAPSGKQQRRRGRVCKFEGCENYIVHKGLCCRHGGGKKCSVADCESSAKHKGRCWKHGGSVECKVPDCNKKAKARGFCWAHGGGTKCTHDSCQKIAISNGLCWAHGGGRRCIFDGCQKPSYERTHSFCLKHYEELQGVDYYEV